MTRPRPPVKTMAELVTTDIIAVLAQELPVAITRGRERWFEFSVYMRDGYPAEMDIESGCSDTVTSTPKASVDSKLAEYNTSIYDIVTSRAIPGFHGKLFFRVEVNGRIAFSSWATQRKKYDWSSHKVPA